MNFSPLKIFLKKNKKLSFFFAITFTIILLIIFSFFLDNKKVSLSPEISVDHQKVTNKTSAVKPEMSIQISPATQAKSATIVNDPSVVSTKLFGSLVSVKTSKLTFQISGYIQTVFVKNGAMVPAGTPLAKLDDAIAKEQLNLAEFEFELAKQNVHYARLALERVKTLMARQATTQVAFEQAESVQKTAETQVKIALANLNLARINQEKTLLKAPFAGYVLNLTTWQGDYVSNTTPILTLVSLDDLQIQVPIPQTVENHFALGDRLPFANPTQNLRGTLVVTGVVPYVDPDSKSYLLVGKPEDVDGTLLAGELVVIELKNLRKEAP